MPAFTVNGRTYHSHVEYALEQVGGRWKLPILWRLRNKPWRYTELRQDIKGITPKMLSTQLKELEESGLISREAFAEVPPRVEYTLTARGHQALPLIDLLRELGHQWLAELEIKK